MRIATVSQNGSPFVALESEGQYFRWNEIYPEAAANSVAELIRVGGLQRPVPDLSTVRPVEEPYEILAPLPRPARDLICLGKNFVAHAEEYDRGMGTTPGSPDDAPIVFAKAASSVCGPYSELTIDSTVTEAVDYEVELAVVIGTGGRNIPADAAYEHVVGYTVLNDLTARDLQRRHQQWFLGKSLDGFGPMGPVLVTADEIPHPEKLKLTCTVDGELRQSATVADMVVDIPQMIALVSSLMTLNPGDILAMGTPEGVGIGFDPPRYLVDGSVVVAGIDAIGELRTRIRTTGGLAESA